MAIAKTGAEVYGDRYLYWVRNWDKKSYHIEFRSKFNPEINTTLDIDGSTLENTINFFKEYGII